MVDKSEKLVWLARLGYFARGVVYSLLGYLAISASGSSAVKQGQAGAMEYINQIPGGTPVLFLSAIGLFGYALFRLSTAVLDTERHGNDAKGIAVRIGHMCSFVIYLGLSWTALRFALGSKAHADSRAQDMAATALTYDLGSVALGAVGIGLVAAALFQVKEAATLGFMKRVTAAAPSFTCWLGRAGYFTRGLVFLVMGWSLIRSGWLESSSEALSLGDAITDLRDISPLYLAVAAGLVLFGVFSMIVARYRIIPDPGGDFEAAKARFT
ncbi:DUF1206 domain-containing protein [Novosphingobium sp. KN65.2]|uniref:DUF1206 domain-containing protein n=1 Tax=Novosphingobium sp. KN65.2 TaxID=1478134 RepID=UPI0005E4BA31|nr:DUF1206 domain-containing protein [Novosphingobium sp. KN65.2]CDO38796.1 conserved membrane hypothetical protein [Novosphingobium sp. KN65.2]